VMTATLELTAGSEAFVVIDVDDYLDARQPAWIALEKAGAVKARDRTVYVNPTPSDVLSAVSRSFPTKYTERGERL
jgi:hypothetical protein